LPENVRPAVEDVRQFLPYKSYRILDVALVRSDRLARTSMKGPDGAAYDVEVSFSPRPEEGRIVVSRFQVARTETPRPLTRIETDQLEWQSAAAPEAPRSVVETSFTADLGKTVVVGSSRLDGGQTALIVLFTALP
jgi:hypothetical protein